MVFQHDVHYTHFANHKSHRVALLRRSPLTPGYREHTPLHQSHEDPFLRKGTVPTFMPEVPVGRVAPHIFLQQSPCYSGYEQSSVCHGSVRWLDKSVLQLEDTGSLSSVDLRLKHSPTHSLPRQPSHHAADGWRQGS